MRALRAAEVTFTVHVEQDDLPVRGNALESGDDAVDKECEDEILARLDRGDVWAWACVEVRATWKGWSGSDYMGACSYADEADFTGANSDYYQDMCGRALESLNETLAATAKILLTLDAVKRRKIVSL